MTSKIQIISNAYFQLGKGHITALNQQSELDMGASAIYDSVIPATLATFNYSFARKFSKLNKNVIAPTDSNYSTSFALPSDYLALIGFQKGTESFNYIIYGNDIWCNKEELSINYVYEPSDSLFPPQFSLYLIYVMCAHLAMPITNKLDIMKYWEKKSEIYYGIASSSISNQEPSKLIVSNPLISTFVS